MKNLICPTCGSRNLLLDEKNNLTFCKSCSHIFQTDQKVEVSYDAAYAHKYDNYPHQIISEIRLSLVLATGLVAGSKVLDVGYGNGSFVKTLERAGFDAYGADVHGEDFGIKEVILSEVDSDQFDCITFFDSLEHFDDLKLVSHMRPKFLIVSIPERHDYIMTDPKKWRHYRPGEHLHYFSHHSLSVFLMDKLHGYSLIYGGYDEDEVRGKLEVDGIAHNNIYTGVYKRI